MAALSRIAALPGEGRYAVSFVRPDGTEQTAVVHLGAQGLIVADAGRPAGWSRDSATLTAIEAAVRAFDQARTRVPTGPALRDVEGGWDVSLGNVVLGPSGEPICSAHGRMTATEPDEFECTECHARAVLIG